MKKWIARGFLALNALIAIGFAIHMVGWVDILGVSLTALWLASFAWSTFNA